MERWLEGVLILVSTGALLALATVAWGRIVARRRMPGPGLHVLLLARDREEAVEGVWRGLLRLQGAGGAVRSVGAVDCGSRDGTGPVLERLTFPRRLEAGSWPRDGAGPEPPPAAALEWLWSRCRPRPTLVLCLGPGVDARQLLRTAWSVAPSAGERAQAGG